MDPVTAVGLASSVLQCVEFGIELLSTTHNIYTSHAGETEQFSDLATSAARSEALCDDLVRRRSSAIHSATNPKNEAILRISAECLELANRLKVTLLDLKAKPGSLRSSAKQAIRSSWKASDIRAAEKRLDKLQRELSSHLIATLDERQSTTLRLLQQLDADHKEMDIKSENRLESLRIDILSGLRKTSVQPVPPLLLSLAQDSERIYGEESLLKSLAFTGMDTRRASIRKNESRTFEWIYQDGMHDGTGIFFKKWLVEGSDAYLITSKAGAGKSTLMRFLSDDKRTTDSLEIWAAPSKLVFGSYFFWYAGNHLQKSQEGLLRSLLFDILKQCPESIPYIQKRLSTQRGFSAIGPLDDLWTASLLKECFDTLIETLTADTKFCFFIDGLDEYQGANVELADAIQALMASRNVKFCMSARPRNAYEKAFGGNPEYNLTLHLHTKNDINLFIRERLGVDEIQKTPVLTAQETELLVQVIVRQAKGVFLWVFLVVRKIRNSMPNMDDIATMLRRVSEFPRDLDAYFMRILDEIDPIYKEESSIILTLLSERLKPLGSRKIDFGPVPLLTLYYAIQKRFGLDSFRNEYDCGRELFEKAKKRLYARCLDLIEINSAWNQDHDPGDATVSLMHRTVDDFLRQPQIYEKIQQGLPVCFKEMTYRCGGSIAHLAYGWHLDLLGSTAVMYADCFRHMADAYRLSEETEKPQLTKLLDEAEQMIEASSRRIISKDPHNFSRHWTSQLDGIEVLSTAIEFGCKEYVAYRFSQNPSLMRKFAGASPLSRMTITWQSVETQYSTLEYLIKLGVDPESFEITLGHLYESYNRSDKRDVDRRYIANLYILLLEHGMAPDAVVSLFRIPKHFYSFAEFHKKTMHHKEAMLAICLPEDSDRILYAVKQRQRRSPNELLSHDSKPEAVASSKTNLKRMENQSRTSLGNIFKIFRYK